MYYYYNYYFTAELLTCCFCVCGQTGLDTGQQSQKRNWKW